MHWHLTHWIIWKNYQLNVTDMESTAIQKWKAIISMFWTFDWHIQSSTTSWCHFPCCANFGWRGGQVNFGSMTSAFLWFFVTWRDQWLCKYFNNWSWKSDLFIQEWFPCWNIYTIVSICCDICVSGNQPIWGKYLITNGIFQNITFFTCASEWITQSILIILPFHLFKRASFPIRFWLLSLVNIFRVLYILFFSDHVPMHA